LNLCGLFFSNAASVLPSVPVGTRRHHFFALRKKSSQIFSTFLAKNSIS